MQTETLAERAQQVEGAEALDVDPGHQPVGLEPVEVAHRGKRLLGKPLGPVGDRANRGRDRFGGRQHQRPGRRADRRAMGQPAKRPCLRRRSLIGVARRCRRGGCHGVTFLAQAQRAVQPGVTPAHHRATGSKGAVPGRPPANFMIGCPDAGRATRLLQTVP